MSSQSIYNPPEEKQSTEGPIGTKREKAGGILYECVSIDVLRLHSGVEIDTCYGDDTPVSGISSQNVIVVIESEDLQHHHSYAEAMRELC